MSHFTTSEDRSAATPKAWLKVGAQIGDLVNEWSDRSDVVAFVGPGAGGEAPACFKPLIAEMEINVDVAFAPGIDPARIGDITERRTQFDWPEGTGAILHEAMHAKHSRWSFIELGEHPRPLAAQIAVLFEEGRIEARGVTRYPKNRGFLRACAIGIVLKETKPEDVVNAGWFGVSQMILLTLARVDAGVLDERDVEEIRAKVVELLGEELLEKLRKLWIAAQLHANDTQVTRLLQLADEWLELMKDAGHDMEEEQQAGQDALAEALGEMMEAMGEMAGAVEVSAGTEVMAQMGREAREAEAAERAAEKREEGEHRELAGKVFGGKASEPGDYGRTRSRLVRERTPADKERAAAAMISKQLEKARYHDRIVEVRRSAIPPGKMRMQAVMQGNVERARGAISTVQPFKSKRRHHTVDPNVLVGCMVDLSGSMSAAMEPMGVTAWLMADACRRINARFAMIAYGNSIFPMLRSGQPMEKVRVYSAPDNTEEFDPAFRALDGELNLLHNDGARLLVLVSDMAYRSDMAPKAMRWIERCSAAGVAVLILPYDDGSYARAYGKIPGVEIIRGELDPVRTAGAIGAAAVKALNAASR